MKRYKQLFKKALVEKNRNGTGFAKFKGVVRVVKFKCFWFSLNDKAEGLKNLISILNELVKALSPGSLRVNFIYNTV